ncbi:MAG: PD-(D/E)XK nuclease family protein, partial [Ignavibacteria bacterium]|nr:PD-(D/E)XK nuclease family protein [Ignavibacteria bacterium]
GKVLGPEVVDPERMSALIDDAFRKAFGSQELGNQYLMKLQLKDHLTRYLVEYEDPRLRPGGTMLVSVESDVRVEKRGYRFRGRIDRVEKKGDGTVIQDYKTSGDKRRLTINPEKIVIDQRSTWAEGIGSFQLPLYLLLYAESSGSDAAGITPLYILLGKNDIDPSIEIPLFDETQPFHLLWPLLEELMFALLDELTNEETPFLPTHDLEANCPYCPFTRLCGTSWVRRRSRS